MAHSELSAGTATFFNILIHGPNAKESLYSFFWSVCTCVTGGGGKCRQRWVRGNPKITLSTFQSLQISPNRLWSRSTKVLFRFKCTIFYYTCCIFYQSSNYIPLLYWSYSATQPIIIGYIQVSFIKKRGFKSRTI